VNPSSNQTRAASYLENLHNAVLSEDQLRTMEIEPRRKFLGPVGEGILLEVYGPRGAGKSLFRDALAICLTRGMDLGPFKSESPASVLIVDGEMTLSTLKERRTLAANLPAALKPLDLISNEHMHASTGLAVNLAEENWRMAFLEFIRATGDRWDVIVFDNLSAFLPGLKENDMDAWAPINQFLLELRWMGKCVIFVHHAGKSGEQRGTSAREDALDYVIKLTLPAGYNPDDGCRFDVTLTKSRSLMGPEAVPFQFAIVEDGDGNLTWTTKNLRESKKEIIIALMGNGVSQKAVVEIVGVNKAYVSRIRAAAIRQGLLTGDGSDFTSLGRELYGHYDVEPLLS